jgi:hypothetical protein
MVKYPYCQNLRFLVVKKTQLDSNGITEKEHEQNLRLAAAYLTDRRLLYQKLKQLREMPPKPIFMAASMLSLNAEMSEESIFELAALSEIEQKRQAQMVEMLQGEATSDTMPPLSSSLDTMPLSLADDLATHLTDDVDETDFTLPPIAATNNLVDDMLEYTENVDNQQDKCQNDEIEKTISLADSLANDEDLDAILAILASPDATIQAELEAKAAEKSNAETPTFITSTSPEEHLAIVAALLGETVADTEGLENGATSTASEPFTVAAPTPTVAEVATKYDEDIVPEPLKPLPPKPEFSRLELSDFAEDFFEKEYQLAAQQLAAQQVAIIKLFDDEFGSKLEAVNLNDITTLTNDENGENEEDLSWELKKDPPPSVVAPKPAKKKVSFDAWLGQFAAKSEKQPDLKPQPSELPSIGYADENSNILDIDSQDIDPNMRRINAQQLDRLFENIEPLGDLPLMKPTTRKVAEAPTKKVKKSKKENTMHILAERSITPDSDLISETLAALLAKQEKNEEAMAMYEKLSLKFPEKSVFFAAKIAELKLRS